MEATIHMHRRLYSLDYLFPDSPLSEKKSYQELLNGILAFRYVLAS